MIKEKRESSSRIVHKMNLQSNNDMYNYQNSNTLLDKAKSTSSTIAQKTQNINESIKLWRKAAENGDPLAQANIGMYYAFGDCIEPNFNKAVKWWRKAAKNGDKLAIGVDDTQSMF